MSLRASNHPFLPYVWEIVRILILMKNDLVQLNLPSIPRLVLRLQSGQKKIGAQSSVCTSLCQKQKKFEFCFTELVALEGWYGDPRKRFSNL